MAQDAPTTEAPAPSTPAAPAAEEVVNAWVPREQPESPSPQAAEPASPPDKPDAAASAPTKDTGNDAPPPAPVDWKSALDTADAKELRSHPKVAGIVGDLLNRERERQREQIVSELATQAQQAELQRLRRTDPEAYVAQLDELEAAQSRNSATYGGVQQQVAAFQNTLPPEVQEKLSGRQYQGSYEQGFRAYLDDVVKEATEHTVQTRLEAERAKWEKEVLPALRLQVLGQLNGGEPTPDSGAGSPAGARVINDADVAAMSQEEFDALFDQYGRPKPGVDFRPSGGKANGLAVSSR